MNSPLTRTRILGLAALSVLATSVAAQSTWAQHGELLIGAGDQVPGLATGLTVYLTNGLGLDTPNNDQNGTVVVRIRIADTGGVGTLTGLNDRGYLVGRAKDDLQLVVRSDDPAPGIPGATLRSSSASGSSGLNGTPRISPFGNLLFWASSIYDATTPTNTPTTADTALFWGPPLTPLLFIREGDQVPGLAAGVLWGSVTSNFSTQYAHINASGRTLGQTPLAGAVTTADDTIIWTGYPGSIEIISREGDVVSNPSGAVVIPVTGSTMGFIGHLNEGGQVLHEMRFSTTTGTATTANDRALALWTPGSPATNVIIALENDPIPALPGVFIGNPADSWSPSVGGFTRAGTTLLVTDIKGAVTAGLDDRALLYGGAGGWTVVARRNDPAPGIAGATFSQFNNNGTSVNAAGRVAFWASLAGTVGGANDDTALFTGTAGSLTKLAQEGDPVTATGLAGGPWFYRNISQTPHLNDLNQVLWQVEVTDNTFIKTIGLAYDPSTGWRCVYDLTENVTTSQGTGNPTGLSIGGNFESSDGGRNWFNNQGDWVGKFGLSLTQRNAIVRGHVGTMTCVPSSVTAAGGTAQQFFIDAGPSHGNSFYFVLATALGTRPGFPSPIGPQQIPLNFDPLWTNLSISAVNSPIWVNTLGITDANGVGLGVSGFVMPTGFPGFNGVTVHHAALFFDLSITSTFVTEPSALLLY